MVVLTLTASGSISDYLDTSSLQQGVATAAGVDKSLVKIEVAAASVIITATIAVPASTTGVVVQASLASTLGTAATASTALGITVESVPRTALRLADSEASIESESSDGGVSAAAIVGAILGALALGSLLGGWLVCRMCVRKREVAKRISSQLSGVPTQNKMGVEVVLDGTEIAEKRVEEADKRDRV